MLPKKTPSMRRLPWTRTSNLRWSKTALGASSSSQPELGADWQWTLVLFAAALFLWLVNLGGVALRDWDEGTYAMVARAIHRSGDWIFLTLQDQPFLLKPPLLEWLIALGYQVGGIHEWTTRLLPAIVTALSVPLLYQIGRLLFEKQQVALSAACVYLTLLPVVRHGRLAMHDGIAVTAFLLLILCCLKARRQRIWGLGIGIAVGLIGLSKGILMLLLVAIASLFLVWENETALLFHPYTGLGLILGGLPLVGWYAAQAQRYGVTFWQVHFLSQSFNRVWQSVEGNRGPMWYYLLELLKYGWPGLIFLPLGGIWLWRYRYVTWAKLAGLGVVCYLGPISVMGTKLPWYVMPVYPFLALIIAIGLSQVWQISRRYRQAHAGVIGFFAISTGIAGIALAWIEQKPTLFGLGLILGGTLGLTSWQLWRSDRRFQFTLLTGLYLALTVLMISPLWLWELNEAFPVRPVAALIHQATPQNAVIYTSFAYSRPSLDFYSDRPVHPIGTQNLQDLWRSGSYLLLNDPALEQLNALRSQSQILGHAEGFTLLQRRP